MRWLVLASLWGLVAGMLGCDGRPRASSNVKMLALGDSYTIGEGVAAGERWPERVAAGLGWPAPQIIARTGWTAGELLQAMGSAKLDSGGYDWVTVLIGVNNQYRGQTAQEFRPQLQEVLRQAVALARSRADRVVVVSIPDWGVTPFGVRAQEAGMDGVSGQIDAFNVACHEEAVRSGARWVDITGISRKDPADVVGDGLHPSPQQYVAWAGLVQGALSK